jgi:class 3 adenylate cyclase/predicted ATPase
MTFEEIVDQAIEMVRRRGQVSYRMLKRQFDLDDASFEDLKDEILYSQSHIVDDEGRGLAWRGDTEPEASSLSASVPASAPATAQKPLPISHTPQHLTEKILTSRSVLGGERKQVTVCFADIKDSTELIKDLDPEAAQQLLDPAIHIMMEAVHRFEGTVNQVLGDGIMALFGAPIAHEDHAARACYAALAMQTAMQPYADEMFRSHGITLQIRVGLNSGEVVVRTIGNDLHMDYSAVGQTTNLASRMEQLAAPGTITLTDATWRLVQGMVRVNARGPVPVKGMPEPVEVYELIGASTIRRRLQAAVARGLTKFVGRDTEIAVLYQALEQAKAGHGQIVAAVGEAGVGKSRLVYEVVHSHRIQGWRVLESASVSYGKATPYFPVVDLLKRYVHVDNDDDPRTIRAKVTGQILTLDESLQETIPALLSLLDALPEDSPFLELDPPQRRQRTLDGLKRILLRESQVQPLLLVFEDLHWIDSETQALLDSLVESLPTSQLLLLVNYRPEYQHAWGSKTFYTQVRLDPLPPESADAFLVALLGDDPSLQPLKKLLIEQTEGNPFFLEESVRTLVETRVLVGASGAYHLTQQLPSIQVPPTVQAVLAARIDRLSQEEKWLLQTAAVIGNEVPLPLLQAIAEMPEEALHRGLTHLQTAEFLYETSLFPERVYTFKHALTQNVAYQSLLTRTRQQVHQKVAQALEEHFADSAETQPELLAHHFTEAGLPARAVVYWQRAGERASERSAYAAAIAHLRQGLELLQGLPESAERVQHELLLQCTLAKSLTASQGYTNPQVVQAYTRAYELCRQIGETPQLFPVLTGLITSYVNRGEVYTARELGEELLSLAERQHDNARLQNVHFSLGFALSRLGEFTLSRSHLEQSMACYTPQPLTTRTSRDLAGIQIGCLIVMAEVLWLLGYPDQTLSRLHEAQSLAHELGHPLTLAVVLNHTCALHWCRREVQEVKERGETLITLASDQGFPTWVMRGKMFQGWALAMQGQAEDGIAQMRQCLASLHDERGEQLMLPQTILLAEAYRAGGRVQEGLSVVDKALAAVDNTGVHYREAALYWLKGELLLKQVRPDISQAETCFRQALNVARHQQAKSLELRAAMSLARLWQQQGKRQDAYDLLASVYGWFTEGFDTADLKDARALLEELQQ